MKSDEYIGLAREQKKMEHESDSDTNCNLCARYSLQTIDKGTREPEIRRRVETIKTAVLLTSARIQRRLL